MRIVLLVLALILCASIALLIGLRRGRMSVYSNDRVLLYVADYKIGLYLRLGGTATPYEWRYCGICIRRLIMVRGASNKPSAVYVHVALPLPLLCAMDATFLLLGAWIANELRK